MLQLVGQPGRAPTGEATANVADESLSRSIRLAFWGTVVAVLAAVASSSLLPKLLILGPFSDYGFHISASRTMAYGFEPKTPHFLFQALTALAAHWTTSCDFESAGIFVTMSAYAASAFVTFLILATAGPPTNSRLVGCAGLSLALGVVGPWVFWTAAQRNLYFGYICPNTWHNPTVVLMKPFAIGWMALLAVATTRQTQRKPASGWIIANIAGLLGLLATLAKPSLSICVLPALAVLAPAVPRRSWIPTILACIPVVGTLVWQFGFAFHGADGTGPRAGIDFAPLTVMKSLSGALWLKFAMSIVFPVVVALAFPARLRTDRFLQLSWLTFFAGAAFAYLCAEAGPRRYHGNFLWSAHAALFVLFVASTRTCICAWDDFLASAVDRNAAVATTTRFALTSSAFALHVAGGLIFLRVFMTGQSGKGWY